MNLSAWHDRIRRDPAEAARYFLTQARTLAPDQAPAIWAWLSDEATLAAAMARGRHGPLGGAPFVLKDLYDVGGVPTRAGGRWPAALTPPAKHDGHLALDLAAQSLALAGKTHLHEFAYGLTGANPHYGHVTHPRHPDRTSGGSSSGSAALVAAGLCPVAFGTDTGGSIRVPAAFCGLHGMRLTPAHPWITDAFPLAPSFDTPGWFTATAEDMRLTLEHLLGMSPPTREPRGVWLDAGTVGAVIDEEATSTAQARTALKLSDPASAELGEAFRAVHAEGATTYAVLQSTEAYAEHRPWLDAHREHYGTAVWALIDRGRHWTVAQHDQAQEQRTQVRRFWRTFFEQYDFCVLPATPFTALPLNACTLGNRHRLLHLQAPASLAGLPVLTLPVALPGGLSTGLQIIVNDARSPVLAWVLAAGAGE